VLCLLPANRTQSKFVEHHSCPMHDDSTALNDDRLTGLEVVDDDDSATATDTRQPSRLPSERQRYNPTLTDAGKSASSPRRTERRPPDTVDAPASTFLLLLVVACILLMMLVVGSLSYCVAVRWDWHNVWSHLGRPSAVGAMSTGSGLVHCWGRNGKLRITVGHVTAVAQWVGGR